MPIEIAGRRIGPEAPPFVVAEMSGNHNQSLERALEIVDAAAAAGAHALKIQTYTPGTMTIAAEGSDFVVNDAASPWKGRSFHDLYKEAQTPWEWHAPIFERCQRHGMLGFSSPFDASAVDFLESLDVPLYKIASFENIDLPLIEKVAATGKPMIMSTGMATVAELDEAVRTARAAGCRDLVLLKCTSTYPATPLDSNLLTIPHMRSLFGCEIGLSDHTMGVGVPVAAVALGAVAVEKHFTLARADGGVDSAFSLEPAELHTLVIETERAWQALGGVRYGPTDAERKSLAYRRSVYVVTDVQAGETFTEQNLRIIRPGHGLPPKFQRIALGRKAARDVRRGTPLSWDLIG